MPGGPPNRGDEAEDIDLSRKDGSRRGIYLCRHVADVTGLCDAPPIDAELIDTHFVNELQRYLSDFEAWRDQLQSGYGSEHERLERELSTAADSCSEQERICDRLERAIGLADDEAQTKVAMRAAAKAEEDLARERTRLVAVQQALEEVPDEAPADARQVAHARQRGDTRPKHFIPLFSCAGGCGPSIPFIYIRPHRPRYVKFWLRKATIVRPSSPAIALS